MMRYLLSGAVVAAPVLICMAAVIYLLSPSSDVPVTHIEQAPASPAPGSGGGAFPWMPGAGGNRDASTATAPDDTKASTVTTAKYAGEASTLEQAVRWEGLAFAETSDLQTRAESLVNLTLVDPARGEYALGAMTASDRVDDRHLAVALLRDWRDRTGDYDGRIAALLTQAAGDPDAGIAYQARAALEPSESYAQSDSDEYQREIDHASADGASD